ncbi:MAG: Gfo/Idh/MocA family oxidoreductase, partial [bacterium]
MDLRIGMVGYKFMGKAHSNAWGQVNRFFSPGAKAVMRAVCGRNEGAVRGFAENWGWQSVETDWRRLVSREDIDVVDIATPNDTHAVIAIEAAKRGKHVICEKPLGMSLAQTKTMLAAVRKAKVRNMVWHNYRRIPALQLARRIVEEGRLGRIYHVKAHYCQSWIMDPNFPLVWRLQKKVSGSGTHGDINAHIIDATRFVTGSEPVEVCAHMETFIKTRPLGAMAGGLKAAKVKGRGKVDVDDAVIALAKFANGAIATYEATRFASGRKNGWGFEINGAKGSVAFEFERMNELNYFSESDPPHLQGFRNILVTEGGQHKYVGAWWPAGHIIGYEHTFVNQAADFLEGVAKHRPLSPDFLDSTRNQAVLEAMSESSRRRRWTKVQKVN